MTALIKPRDMETLRNAYKLLAIFREIDSIQGNSATLAEYVKAQKHAIRQYTHDKHNTRTIDGYTIETRAIKTDFDGYIELIKLPGTITTEEEAESFFEAFIKIEYRYRDYDCTGQLFTAWHKTYSRAGNYYIYHCVQCDC